MSSRILLFTIAFLVFSVFPSYGSELRIGVDSNFIVDNNNMNDTANSLRTFIDGYGQLNLGSDSGIFLTSGLIYMQRKAAVSSTSLGNLTSVNPYFGLTLGFCSAKFKCSIGAYYSPFVKAQYSETGSELETWLGSSYYTKISLRPQLSPAWAVTISVSYFSASYTVKGDAASVSSADKFQTSSILPMIGLQYVWQSEEKSF